MLDLTEVEMNQTKYVTEYMVTSDHTDPGDSSKKQKKRNNKLAPDNFSDIASEF
jgi:hypothetical protein